MPMDSAPDTPKGGLPHSDIHGSTPARGSPWLFAACHVLHRLLVPRHPPNALLILNPERARARPHHARKPPTVISDPLSRRQQPPPQPTAPSTIPAGSSLLGTQQEPVQRIRIRPQTRPDPDTTDGPFPRL